MSEKCKSCAIQVKNRRKKVTILDIISRLEKDERIVDMRHCVGFTDSSLSIIRYNADRITESVKSINKVLAQKITTVPTE